MTPTTMQPRPMPAWAYPRAYIANPTDGSTSPRRVAWNRPASPTAQA